MPRLNREHLNFPPLQLLFHIHPRLLALILLSGDLDDHRLRVWQILFWSLVVALLGWQSP